MTQQISRIGRFVTLALLAGVCSSSFAAARLEQVKVNPLLADQLQLELTFNEPVTAFSDRLKYQPNQLLVHLPAASSGLAMNQIPVERKGI
ncbi:MAG: pilus assembly protein PilQ, partial [Aeromonadaceae bacterium]